MDRLKQIESFVAVVARGSLAAAARAEGVAAAVLSRRLDALETRLGARLLLRTTRRLTLTQEGAGYLEDCQRLLAELASAEAAVAAGGARATGHLRITAPAGFGRRHVASLVPSFTREHPELTLSLNLSDRVVDLINEGYDCAIRIGELTDSTLVAVRLADNHRRVVATPDYLRRRGRPQRPEDLAHHDCLVLSSESSQSRGWLFLSEDKALRIKPPARLDCSDGHILYEWCLAGMGLAWRSSWEIQDDLASGRLVSVLDDYAAPPSGVYALLPQRKHLPVRVRAWLDHLRRHYADPRYWARNQAAEAVTSGVAADTWSHAPAGRP